MTPATSAPSPLYEYGLLGMVVLYTIRELFGLVRQRSNTGGTERHKAIMKTLTAIEHSLIPLAKDVRDLHDWHNVTDSEGVKVWYVRKSLEKAITDLSNNIGAQTTAISKIHQTLHDIDLRAQFETEKD